MVIILIAHPKSQNSGIPFLPYFSGKPSALWLSRDFFLLLSPLKKYYTQTVDQDDLISIGTIGLIKGISSYKPEKNVRLATYAARCIENAILSLARFEVQKMLPLATEPGSSPPFWRFESQHPIAAVFAA